jgi:hypothetical protein
MQRATQSPILPQAQSGSSSASAAFCSGIPRSEMEAMELRQHFFEIKHQREEIMEEVLEADPMEPAILALRSQWFVSFTFYFRISSLISRLCFFQC